MYYYSYATAAPATPVKPKHHHVHIPKGKVITKGTSALPPPPKPNNPLEGVGKGIQGAWQWLQGYSVYGIAIGAIGYFLFFKKDNNPFGILGRIFFLGLLLVSSAVFLTNLIGIPLPNIPNLLSVVPDAGKPIRKAINPNNN
jgi:hypothetical protein